MPTECRQDKTKMKSLSKVGCCYFLLLNTLAAQQQVLRLKLIPSELEIVNPLRGLYTWLAFHVAPQPDTALDSYLRIPWAALEPEESRYDFSPIEKELAVLPKGGKFAFRIVALNPSWSWQDGSDVPKYLMERLPKGFFVPAIARTPGAPAHLYVPDWNSPIFLSRVDELLAALGRRYDGDPRISFIDIGVYGTWAEWHTFGLSNFPGGAIPYDDARLNPQGARPGFFASRQHIVDAHANAFKKTRLVMMTDDKEALTYALRLPTPLPIGMRRDSFGSNHFADDFLGKAMSPADQDLILNRWRTAPVIVESFGPPKAFQVGPRGLTEQVERYHIAAIGNGNFGDWNKLTPNEQEAVLAAGRRSGYRFALTTVTLPVAIKPGDKIPLKTTWENLGVTPSYEPWTIEFTLWKENGSRAVARVVSGLDLQTLLPSTQAREATDILAIPKKVSKGNYELRVRISDPSSYRNPLRLALESATPDGGYSLGTICVD